MKKLALFSLLMAFIQLSSFASDGPKNKHFRHHAKVIIVQHPSGHLNFKHPRAHKAIGAAPNNVRHIQKCRNRSKVIRKRNMHMHPLRK